MSDTTQTQAQAREEYQIAYDNYTDPPIDWDRDDMRWAYQALKRAELKIRSFDVV